MVDAEVAAQRDGGKQRDIGNRRCPADEPTRAVKFAPRHVIVHDTECVARGATDVLLIGFDFQQSMRPGK